MALLGGNLQIDHVCKMLASPDTEHDIRNVILDNLKSTKETWLLYGLVDYYFQSPSQKVQDILAELRDFQAKALIDKLNDGIKTPEHKLPALQLLLYLAYKELPWSHLLMDSPVILSLLKFLKTENDAVVVMTSLMILVILLPSVPDSFSQHLPTLFEIFGRLATYCCKKTAVTSEAYFVHIHVALYSLFNRLYGMYPCLFLSFLNKFCTARENNNVYEEVIMPMIERVRLHPRLITGLKETETSKSRWKDQETQDIVVNCSKYSLDLIEGSWEDSPLHLFPIAQNHDKSSLSADNSADNSEPSKEESKPSESAASGSCKEKVSAISMHVPTIDPSYLGESPSVLIGLSTPPSSHRTTPTASFIESNLNSGGPLDTPELTPRLQTPSHWEDGDKTPYSGIRNVPTSSDSKKHGPLQFNTTPGSNGLNSPNILTSDVSSISSKPSSAARYLPFNSPQEDKQEAEKKEFKTTFQETVKHCPEIDEPKVSDELSRFSTVPVASLPQIISTLATPDSDALDQEVAEITEKEDNFDDSSSPSSSVTTMTSQTDVIAESVRQFMKKVNRIRFNSLTSNSSSDYDAVSIPQGTTQLAAHRARSCPPFRRQVHFAPPPVVCKGNGKKQASAGQSFVAKGYNRQTSMIDQPHPGGDTSQRKSCSKGNSKESSVEKNPSQCFQSDYQGNNISVFFSAPVIFNPVIQYIFAPSKLSVCNYCHKQLVVTSSHVSPQTTTLVTYKGNEAPLFSSVPPPELLDRHIRLGSDIHNKELTALPVITKDSTNWTHFGGNPPVDEVNILKNQLLMLQNQLLYERHKRINHDKRNRRLLRRIAGVATLEEQQTTLLNQVGLHEQTIQNLHVCIKLIEEDNRKMKQMQESDDYERLIKYRLALKENKDLKASSVALKDLLLTQKEDYDKQQKILENLQHKNLETEKELEICKERLMKAENLKEKVFQLQKEVLLMQELHQKCQEKLNFTKASAGQKLEESYLIKSLNSELEVLNKENRKKSNLLEAYQMKAAELETMLKAKETIISDLKLCFEEAKSVHYEKLKAVEDRCKSMVNINQLLEAKCMDLISQLDKAAHRKKLQVLSSELKPSGEIASVNLSGVKEQAVAMVDHRTAATLDREAVLEKSSTHPDSSNCSPSLAITPGSSTSRATVVVAKEEVSLASCAFSESNLTPLPHLLDSRRGQDTISDSGAVSRSSYRGESEASINSFVTGDSGCWHKD